MSNNVIEKYVEHLIVLGDVNENDRIDLEDIFKQTTNGMEKEAIDWFFKEVDAERLKHPDLFNSQKGIEFTEVKRVADSISQRILDYNYLEEMEKNKQTIFKVDAKKVIFSITDSTNSIEVILKTIEATFPEMSKRDADTIAGEIKNTRDRMGLYRQMRNDPKNSGKSAKEIVLEMAEGDEVEAGRFASAMAKDIFLTLASEEVGVISEEDSRRIESDLMDICSMTDQPYSEPEQTPKVIVSDENSTDKYAQVPIEPEKEEVLFEPLLLRAAQISKTASQYSQFTIQRTLGLMEREETVTRIKNLAREEAHRIMYSENSYQESLDAFLERKRVKQGLTSLPTISLESGLVKKEDLMNLISYSDIGKYDVRDGLTGESLSQYDLKNKRKEGTDRQ